MTATGRIPVARPAVTVCVPAHGAGQDLTGLLDALARQTYPNVIIRVSLDDAPDDAPNYELSAPADTATRRVELIRQAEPLGWVGNVDALLGEVETPYFVLLMPHDELTPGYLAAAIDVLERRPEVAVAYGNVRHHGIRDGEIDEMPSISGARLQRIRTLLEREPHEAAVAWRGVIRSSLLRSGLRIRAVGSDREFWTEVFALDLLVHGESVSLPDNYCDEFTDDSETGRAVEPPTAQQRSERVADALVGLLQILTESRFSEDARMELMRACGEWLAEASQLDLRTIAQLRPAIAPYLATRPPSRAAAHAQPTSTFGSGAPVHSPPSARGAPFAPAADTVNGLRARARLKRRVRRALVRLPHIVRRNPLFDADWYLARYPDVAEKRTSAYRHYWRHGIREGRDPNALFETRWYLAHNEDVRMSGMDPLDHYLVFGADQGRDPGPHFDSHWYLGQHPDVAASGLNPLEHYLRYGRAERRQAVDPSKTADTE